MIKQGTQVIVTIPFGATLGYRGPTVPIEIGLVWADKTWYGIDALSKYLVSSDVKELINRIHQESSGSLGVISWKHT